MRKKQIEFVEKEQLLHARRSPSTLKNRELCPGFEPQKKDSVASTEGRNLHRYMELWAISKRTPLAAVLAEELQILDSGLSDEQREQIEKLQQYITPLIEEADSLHLEHKLDMRRLALPGCDFGTADFITIDKAYPTAYLVDYKFGKVEVDDAEDNIQFFAYACAMFQEFCVDQINVVILQPRTDYISEATFTRKDVPRMMLRLKTVLERCENPTEETLNPQTQLCEYCAHVGTCPAVAKFALKISDGPELPKEFDPTKCDDTQLGDLYAWAKLLEEKGKALQHSITELATAGHEVGGFILQASTGKTTVIDPVGLAHEVKKSLNFSDDQLFACADISLTKILDVISKQAPKGQKEKTAQEVRKNLTDGGFFKTGGGYSYLKRSK